MGNGWGIRVRDWPADLGAAVNAIDQNTLVPVSELIGELHIQKSSQLDLCRKYGIQVAFAVPLGRGYKHYITQENAQILRDKISDERSVKASKKQLDEEPRHQSTLAQDVRWIRENMQRLIDALGGIES